MSGSQESAPASAAGRTSGFAAARPCFDWIAAGAFGFAIYQIVVRHSHSPSRTLATLDLSVAGLAVALLLALRLNGRKLAVPRDIGLLLLALAVSVAVSTLASGDVLFSLPRLAMYPVFSLLGVAVYLLYRDAARIPLQAYCLVIAAVHVPFVAELLVWLSYNSQPFYPQGPRVPNFSHVRQFGEAGFLAAASGSGLLALSRRWLVLPFLLTCVALFGIMAFGSRGALLSWALCTVLLIWLVPRRRVVAALTAIAALLTAMVVCTLHVTGLLQSPNLFFRMQQLVERGGSGFDSGRLQFWFESLQVVAAHPLFGLGAEAYLVSGCCDRTISQPHNLALQLLMQTGLVGCALLAWLTWRTVIRLGGPRRSAALLLATAENRVLAAMLLAYLAYCAIDGLFYHPLPLVHFALFSGLLAAGMAKARAS